MASGASRSLADIRRSHFLDYVSLLKPGIVALLLYVALAAAFLAGNGGWQAGSVALLLVTGAMAAGGAGAVNHYLERDLDACMERTRRRPLVLRRIADPRRALALGMGLLTLAVVTALALRPWLAVFLAAGAFVYVVVYTVWLKRRSSWNVVVGGAAGSCAVLSGWAAVGHWWGGEPLLIALLVFFWTPPHFWSLAIYRLDDYRRAGVPMLPVVAGPRRAAFWGLLQVLLTVATSLALAPVGSFGRIYLVAALLAGAVLVATALGQWIDPTRRRARLHFRASIFYLAAVFAGMAADVWLRI